MAKLFKLVAFKTYASEANAIKAVEKKYPSDTGNPRYAGNLRYFIHRSDDGRFFPVFVGEAAIVAGVYLHFNVVG